MRITNKEVALLGLLNERPMHGYQLEKEVADRDMRSWTPISKSTIYKVLKTLEDKGLVKTVVKLTDKNVVQKVSGITAKGKKALREKLKTLLSEPEHMIYQVDLATSNLDVLDPAEQEICLKSYIEKLEAGICCYGELESYLLGCGCPWYRLALARRPQYLLRAEIEWALDFINQAKRRDK